MLILRIRRAEAALADGRLDEAYDIARTDAVRAHYRGQKLIGRLAKALVERGEAHLADSRYAAAMADCDKATLLAGNLPEVGRLREAVLFAQQCRREQVQQQDRVLHLAREQMEKGRLSVVADVVNEAGLNNSPAKALLEEAEAKRLAAEAAVTRASAALDREDYPATIEALAEANRLHAANATLPALRDRAVDGVAAQVQRQLDAGRLDLAADLLERVRPIASGSLRVQELDGVLAQCGLAADALRNHQPRRAAEVLRKLVSSGPHPAWMDTMLAEAVRADQALEALRCGPLGWLLDRGQHASLQEARTLSLPAGGRVAPWPPRPEGGHEPAGDGLPSRLLLYVDAVGTFLVVRGGRVTIGPERRSRPVDIPLNADPSLPVVTIEREEEDYFLSADQPVVVNGRKVQRKLLAGGDSVELSPRCRIKFELPHPASTSAVLSISGVRIPGSDARRVVLLDKAMVMGPGPGAHVRADALREPAVLMVRDGRLVCRTGEAVTVDEAPMDRAAGLPLGGKVAVGAVKLVVAAA